MATRDGIRKSITFMRQYNLAKGPAIESNDALEAVIDVLEPKLKKLDDDDVLEACKAWAGQHRDWCYAEDILETHGALLAARTPVVTAKSGRGARSGQ